MNLGNDRERTRAMLEAVDTELRRLLAEALPLGYTVVVFADNGTASQVGGQKATMYDGGVICPLWVFGPGVSPGIDANPVGAVDLYATVALWFGVPAGFGSGDPTRGPDSRSFLPAWRGSTSRGAGPTQSVSGARGESAHIRRPVASHGPEPAIQARP